METIKKTKFPIAVIFFALSFLKTTILKFETLFLYDTFAFLSFLLSLFLIVVLIRKKTDKLFVISLISIAIYKFLSICFWLISFRGSSILAMIILAFSWLSILLFALVFFEQDLIKYDFAKFRTIAKKLWFVPVILTIISCVVDIFTSPILGIVNKLIASGLDMIISILATLFLTLWIINPYKKEKQIKE